MKQFLKKLAPSLTGKASDPTGPTRLFVHIPKTAGTSFRTAAETRFGTSRVLRDYGPNSAVTSGVVKTKVYEEKDTSKILQAIETEKALLVTGHFPIQKYGRIIGLKNTATIFRDPIEQVISHYRHAVAHHGFEGNLLAFAERKGIRNLQTRFLFNLDPALVGIFGLTESYRETLMLINDRWGWDLKHIKKNVSDRFDRQGVEVSDAERSELELLNSEDRSLYARACHVFGNSLYCLEHRIASDPRGAITSIKIGEPLAGWAFDMCSENPIAVILVVNGKEVAQTNCSHPSAECARWNLTQANYAGFMFEEMASTEDKIEIRDSATGLVLDSEVAT